MKLDKHIALVVPGFPKDEEDTTCLPAVQHYVKALSEKVERVIIFSLHYPYTTKPYMWKGVQVYPLNGKNNFWKRKFKLYRSLKGIFDTVHKQYPVSCIHAFWLNEATTFGADLAEEYGVPVLATAHGQDVLKENKYLKGLSQRNIRFFCLSEYQHKHLRQAGINDVEVTPWGLEPCDFDVEKDIDFISVGNLIPLKNVSYFVKLCQAYNDENNEFRALIIGDGPQKKELQDAIEFGGMTASVKLAGMLDHSKTLHMIVRSKVLIHPSGFEGFGMTMIEALAVGTHVLSTQVGVAAANDQMHHLTLNIEEDLAILKELLEKEVPEPIVYSIDSTVDQYLKIYAGL